MGNLRKKSRHESATDWPAWTNDYRYVPTEADERAASEALNSEDWHDLEGHPTIDDETAAQEAAYRQAENARHEAAEAMIAAELDRMAGESEALDQLERGLRMF